MYPPAQFNIVKLHIHPPYADALIESFQKLLENLSPADFKGLIILQETGHIRVIR